MLAGGARLAGAQQASQRERNKAVVRGFKEAQKLGKSVKEVEAEFMTPNYRRHRGGCRISPPMRPDRVFQAPATICAARSRTVSTPGWRSSPRATWSATCSSSRALTKATCSASEATGKTIDVYEVGIFKPDRRQDSRKPGSWPTSSRCCARSARRCPPARTPSASCRRSPAKARTPTPWSSGSMAGSTRPPSKPATASWSHARRAPRRRKMCAAPHFRQRPRRLPEPAANSANATAPPRQTVTSAMPERRDPIDGLDGRRREGVDAVQARGRALKAALRSAADRPPRRGAGDRHRADRRRQVEGRLVFRRRARAIAATRLRRPVLAP